MRVFWLLALISAFVLIFTYTSSPLYREAGIKSEAQASTQAPQHAAQRADSARPSLNPHLVRLRPSLTITEVSFTTAGRGTVTLHMSLPRQTDSTSPDDNGKMTLGRLGV